MKCRLRFRGRGKTSAEHDVPLEHPDADYVLIKVVSALEATRIPVAFATSVERVANLLEEKISEGAFPVKGPIERIVQLLRRLRRTGNWRLLILARRMYNPDGSLYLIFGFESQRLDAHSDGAEIICDFLVGYLDRYP